MTLVMEATQKNKSILGLDWRIHPCQERQVLAACQRHDYHEILSRILVARGIEIDNMPDFLNPTLKSSMPHPFDLIDMEKAATRAVEAILNQHKIAVFGDYDVDGATSSAVLKRFFAMLGIDLLVYIPDRILEGYGPNTNAINKLKEENNVELLVTVDCGTSSFAPLERAAEIGVDVIVLDHHIGTDSLPSAVAVVNPNRLDEKSPYRYLAAVGVVFLFCVATVIALRNRGFFNDRSEPDLFSLLDLVALGTVCDVVPLQGLNRAFVKQGLKVMAKRQNIGLRSLADVAGISEIASAYHLGFVIGPRINAGGRVGTSNLGATLLASDDHFHSISIAKQLDQFNSERKAIEMLVLDDAIKLAELQHNMPVVMVAGENWHQGVIGIVASRLKEQFNKPTIVLSLSEDVAKASCRSVAGFDIGAAVIAAKMLGLVKLGGGHAMAAGFSADHEQLGALHAFFNERFLSSEYNDSCNIKYYDGNLSPTGVNLDLARLIEAIGPFGAGNPEPKFALCGAKIVKPQVYNNSHVGCLVANWPISEGGLIKATAFRSFETSLGQSILKKQNQPVTLFGYLRINRWQGNEKVEFIIEDAIF
jgi:single-stranded-DNA-specific exonuclease